MNTEIFTKLDVFLEKMEELPEIQEFRCLQKDILKDSILLETIAQFHKLNRYDPEYKMVKQKLFQNALYVKYLNLEQEIYYWTLEMTQQLKALTKGEL